jgi:hypothetical protein
MIVDEIEKLANQLGVDTEVPMGTCDRHLGWLYSRAAFILGRIEERLLIGSAPKHTLGVRFKVAKVVARQHILCREEELS